MSDREFIVEIRKGLIIIMRAMIRRFALSWFDFLPANERPQSPAQTTGVELRPRVETGSKL